MHPDGDFTATAVTLRAVSMLTRNGREPENGTTGFALFDSPARIFWMHRVAMSYARTRAFLLMQYATTTGYQIVWGVISRCPDFQTGAPRECSLPRSRL